MTELLQHITELVAPWDRPGTPGGIVAVARGGVVQECVPFGYANLEHEVRNARDTVFYIASTSKQFVAACVAVLERAGRLSADDPIATWVPEVAHLGDLRVHHLLHHTSGIRDKYALAAIGGLPIDTVGTDRRTLSLLSRQRGLNFEPGSRFMYSNSGYFLLALVVERCSGQSLPEFARQHLFEPLGMSATWFRPDTDEVIPHRAAGHRLGPDGTWKLAEYTLSSLGPGGVVTTADSLARWGLVFSSGALDGLADHLVTTRPLTDGTANNYAYGLQVGAVDGRRMLQHGGGVHGFSAQLVQVPDEDLTVLCLANCTPVNAQLVASQVVEKALGVVRSTASQSVPEHHGAPALGVYLDVDEASIVTIETDPDGQHLIVVMGQRVPLRPVRRNVWAVGVSEMSFDEAGMSLHLADEVRRYHRLDPAPEPADLEPYEGRYASEELGVSLVVGSTPDGLELAWPEQDPHALTCVGADLFTVTVDGATVPVRVLRDRDTITGLRISIERALGTVFARL